MIIIACHNIQNKSLALILPSPVHKMLLNITHQCCHSNFYPLKTLPSRGYVHEEYDQHLSFSWDHSLCSSFFFKFQLTFIIILKHCILNERLLYLPLIKLFINKPAQGMANHQLPTSRTLRAPPRNSCLPKIKTNHKWKLVWLCFLHLLIWNLIHFS